MIFHGGLGACVDAIVKDLGFGESSYNRHVEVETGATLLYRKAMCFYDEWWLGFINPNKENNYSVDTLMKTMIFWG